MKMSLCIKMLFVCCASMTVDAMENPQGDKRVRFRQKSEALKYTLHHIDHGGTLTPCMKCFVAINSTSKTRFKETMGRFEYFVEKNDHEDYTVLRGHHMSEEHGSIDKAAMRAAALRVMASFNPAKTWYVKKVSVVEHPFAICTDTPPIDDSCSVCAIQ